MSFLAIPRACDTCRTLVTCSGNSDDDSLVGACPSCKAAVTVANLPTFVGFGEVTPFHDRHKTAKAKWTSKTVTLPPPIEDVPVEHAVAAQAALDAEAAGPATTVASAVSDETLVTRERDAFGPQGQAVAGETPLEAAIEAAVSSAIKKAASHGA